MSHSIRLAAAALLAAPALVFAQPTVLRQRVSAPPPTPTPVSLADPVQPPTPPPAPPKDEVKSEQPEEKKDEPAEEKKAEERYAVEKLLGRTCGGQRLLENGWRIYGWTQGTYTTGSVQGSNLPVLFTDRARDFSLNQNWLHVEKGIDTEKKQVQIGGAVDLILPGTDARFTPSRGLLDNQVGTNYPIDLFQAYVDVFAPGVGPKGTTFRLGKFATFLEYETVQAISTPFASRSYLFQYNPFTHTGGLAITPLNDDWMVSNGLALGNDNFFGAPSRLTYLGQLKWAPKDGPTTAALGVSVTDPRFDAADAFAFYNVYNFQLTHKLSDCLTYVLDASFSHMDNVPGVGSANWYGAVQYLLYDVSDKVQTKLRVELFEDTQGVRTGNAGLYTAVTGGVQVKVRPWLIVQPEVRYDHASQGGPFRGDRDLFTATIGGIVRW